MRWSLPQADPALFQCGPHDAIASAWCLKMNWDREEAGERILPARGVIFPGEVACLPHVSTLFPHKQRIGPEQHGQVNVAIGPLGSLGPASVEVDPPDQGLTRCPSSHGHSYVLEREVWHAGSFRWLRQVAALAEFADHQPLDPLRNSPVFLSGCLLDGGFHFGLNPNADACGPCHANTC
jgi:hypothetical protein